MRCFVLLCVCLLTLQMFAQGQSHFRYWELMSLAFDEFSVSGDGVLTGKLNGFLESAYFTRKGNEPIRRSSGRECSFSLKPTETLEFGRTRAFSSNVCVLGGDDPAVVEWSLPEPLRGDHHYLQIKIEGVETIVGASSGKAYLPGKKCCIDFSLPFKTVWEDQNDYNLWASGLGCRFRLKNVYSISKAEAQLAESLLKICSSSTGASCIGDSPADGMGNVQVALFPELKQLLPEMVERLVVQVAATNGEQRITGFGFLTCGQCRRARRYRLDASGRLAWAERIDRDDENGSPGRNLLELAFEYGPDGGVRRAWTPGSNPLMIDKGKKLYFTGDRGLTVRFREDLRLSFEGLPRMK